MTLLDMWWAGRVEVFVRPTPGAPYLAHVLSGDSLRIGTGATPREAIIDALSTDEKLEVPA